MTLPRSHVWLLDAQDARITARAVEHATRGDLAGLTAIQASTIARQLRSATASALRAAMRLDRYAADLTRQETQL